MTKSVMHRPYTYLKCSLTSSGERKGERHGRKNYMERQHNGGKKFRNGCVQPDPFGGGQGLLPPGGCLWDI